MKFVVSPKFSMRSCEKQNCCQQQKRIDSFSLFRRENASMIFSDLPLFLINNTKYEFVAVFQNSPRSQKVVDEKESSTRNSCRQHLVLCVYSLKFVNSNVEDLISYYGKVIPGKVIFKNSLCC